ncbi:MAG TPA: hypothetical protein VFG74_11405 [Miltoncostaeaceae bacterium]|jgi:hypothetical protein|nr:hypothetical protein [Miltoncostaeaceae bacterium]
MPTPSGSGAGPRRILVIANETCAGRGVVDEVRYRAGGEGAEVVVVAPALAKSRLEHWLSSDSERRQSEAATRLDESIRAFEAAGMNARGTLGDADPLQALDDALRVFDPDEVIISTHPPARSNWLERQVVRKARERYPMPITHVVVDLTQESMEADRPGRGQMVAPERRLRVFAAAAYDEALAIQSGGFRDRPVPGHNGSGVWVSDRPPAADHGDAWVVFAIDVPEEAAAGYARGDGPEGRQYLMPAELLNRSGPPVQQDDWSE